MWINYYREMTKIGLQMMGMKCWKCRVDMGALCIPVDSEETPKSIMRLLVAKKILPVCEKCIAANPRTISYENMNKGI